MDSFRRLQETWQDKIFYVSQTFRFTFATVRASGINFPSLVRIHSFAQSRENKFIRMVLFILDREVILSKQFCNNVLISLTGFLRISTNLARIESSSRNFSQRGIRDCIHSYASECALHQGRIQEGSSCSEEPTSLMDNAVGLQKRKLGLYPRDSTVETIKAVLERCKYLAWYHLRKAENKINASLYGLFIFQDRRIEILLVLEYFAKEFIDIVILVS